jgi:hypothetical protein
MTQSASMNKQTLMVECAQKHSKNFYVFSVKMQEAIRKMDLHVFSTWGS